MHTARQRDHTHITSLCQPELTYTLTQTQQTNIQFPAVHTHTIQIHTQKHAQREKRTHSLTLLVSTSADTHTQTYIYMGIRRAHHILNPKFTRQIYTPNLHTKTHTHEHTLCQPVCTSFPHTISGHKTCVCVLLTNRVSLFGSFATVEVSLTVMSISNPRQDLPFCNQTNSWMTCA